MDDEALIQYKNVEIHQQELCVLSEVNLELHKGARIFYRFQMPECFLLRHIKV